MHHDVIAPWFFYARKEEESTKLSALSITILGQTYSGHDISKFSLENGYAEITVIGRPEQYAVRDVYIRVPVDMLDITLPSVNIELQLDKSEFGKAVFNTNR